MMIMMMIMIMIWNDDDGYTFTEELWLKSDIYILLYNNTEHTVHDGNIYLIIIIIIMSP